MFITEKKGIDSLNISLCQDQIFQVNVIRERMLLPKFYSCFLANKYVIPFIYIYKYTYIFIYLVHIYV